MLTNMKRPIISSAIDPKKLSSTEKKQLTEDLYRVHSDIFDGVSKEAFRRYVLDAPTFRSRIFTFQNEDGNIVGYITHQQYVVRIGSHKRNVFRTEVGLQPIYRGCNSASMILFRENLKAYIRTGFRKAWFVATPIHPTPYRIAVRHLHAIYPHPNRPMGPKEQKLLSEISSSLQLEQGGQGLPLQKKVGWITRETPARRERIAGSPDESVRFYLSQNPHYQEGMGMIMVIPVTVRNGLSMLHTFLFRKIRKTALPKVKDVRTKSPPTLVRA
jgi:hypothetical protein